jgi:hypothetical protein
VSGVQKTSCDVLAGVPESSCDDVRDAHLPRWRRGWATAPIASSYSFTCDAVGVNLRTRPPRPPMQYNVKRIETGRRR